MMCIKSNITKMSLIQIIFLRIVSKTDVIVWELNQAFYMSVYKNVDTNTIFTV